MSNVALQPNWLYENALTAVHDGSVILAGVRAPGCEKVPSWLSPFTYGVGSGAREPIIQPAEKITQHTVAKEILALVTHDPSISADENASAQQEQFEKGAYGFFAFLPYTTSKQGSKGLAASIYAFPSTKMSLEIHSRLPATTGGLAEAIHISGDDLVIDALKTLIHDTEPHASAICVEMRDLTKLVASRQNTNTALAAMANDSKKSRSFRFWK